MISEVKGQHYSSLDSGDKMKPVMLIGHFRKIC
jgi:hypothetical protein